jgi:hypothetical protein
VRTCPSADDYLVENLMVERSRQKGTGDTMTEIIMIAQPPNWDG